MARPSTIDRLPIEFRELVTGLRDQGKTIEEIGAALARLGAPVSRAALGRHTQKLDANRPMKLAAEISGLRHTMTTLAPALIKLAGRIEAIDRQLGDIAAEARMAWRAVQELRKDVLGEARAARAVRS
jgi:Bacteriophage Mu, Gp27